MIARILSAGLGSLLLVVMISGPASAAENEGTHGFYALATVGWNIFDVSGDSDDNTSFGDDDDFGWDVGAGYQITRNFGIEGGFMNTGGLSGRSRDNELTSVDADSEGGYAQLVGNLPVWCNEHLAVSLIGIGGAYFYDLNVDSRTGDLPSTSEDPAGRGVAGIAGAGVQFDMFKHVELRLSYRRLIDMEDFDANMVAASIIFTQWP